jgi:chromosomal replication initiator protein
MYSCEKIAQQKDADPEMARNLRQISDRITLPSQASNQSRR